MGICVGKANHTQTIERCIVEHLEVEPRKVPSGVYKSLTIFKPPESVLLPPTTGEHLPESGDHSGEEGKTPVETRGIMMLSNLNVRISGTQAPGRQREFEEKPVTRTGDDISADFLQSLGIAVTCKKGLKPESPNQDDYCLMIQDAFLVLGVFDGHGPSGHQVSSYVSARLPAAISQHEQFQHSPGDSFISSFYQVQQDLSSRPTDGKRSFDTVYSGTTATIAIITEKQLFVGHVGDSRAVMSRYDQSTNSRTVLAVTADHRPSLDNERERIESAGGEVKTLAGDHTCRVFFPGKDFPGLAMSRALGDAISHQVGVIARPDVFECEITPEDEFLLMCSDGVWEFISNADAVETVGRLGKAKVSEAAEALAKQAWKAWVHQEGDVVDDITVLIAYLH